MSSLLSTAAPMVATQISDGFFLSTASSFIPALNPDGVTDWNKTQKMLINHRQFKNNLDDFRLNRLSMPRTHCVQALEKVFWGKLTPAVLHIHAPIKLSILAVYKTHSVRKVVLGKKITKRVWKSVCVFLPLGNNNLCPFFSHQPAGFRSHESAFAQKS